MNKNMLRKLIILVSLSLVSTYTYFYATRYAAPTPPLDIASFEECAAAGYPIMESYPERCSVPGGGTFTRVTTDTLPTPITVAGLYTCLPKVNTGGPVTLECALGLKTDDGYYALDTSSILSANYPSLERGEKIVVEGVVVPIEMISSDRWQTYDVVGIIAVEKITIN